MSQLRTILVVLSVVLVLPAVDASPVTVPIPGPGTVGTPAFIDLPRTCDPIGLLCVGPVYEPAPVGVIIVANGFVLVIDPAGTPGSTLGPSYHNVTIGSITVPVVLCPNGCNVPATPTADEEGGVSVQVTGPFTCTVSILQPGTSCNPSPVPCDPLDFGGCGLPDPRDHCVRSNTEDVPDCFVPVVVGCDPLDPYVCAFALLEIVFEALDLVLDLLPDANDLCDAGTFPACLVSEAPECADNPPNCIGDAPDLEELIGNLIKPCSESSEAPVRLYACYDDTDGRLVIVYPTGSIKV